MESLKLMQTIYLALTVDLDPDNFDDSIFGLSNKLTWRGIDEGLPEFLEKIHEIKDSFGHGPLFTWFVRADRELLDVYGDYNYLFTRYFDFLKKRQDEGDEIGWHPHEKDFDNLQPSYNALEKTDRKFVSVRVGNSFHSNNFMDFFSKCGFKVDGTALPGRVRNDKERVLDWQGTPEKPYFPSVHDYRLVGGDKCHQILEVPFSMLETQSNKDSKPIKRYLNLSYKHELIRNALLDSILDKDLLVAIIHPSELLKNELKHPIISFDINTVIKNLEFILGQAAVQEKKIKFITMKEVWELVKQNNISHA